MMNARKLRTTLWLLLVLAWVAFPIAAQETPFQAGVGISGAWYDPDRSGEGFQIQILDGDRGLIYWFTYDRDGNQMWLIGTGPVSGNTLDITDTIVTSGGRFGEDFDPDDVLSSPWGTLHFEFTDCDAATVEYAGPPELGSGSIDLVRLSGSRAAPCSRARSFLLGFTSLPFEVSDAGLDNAYAIIRESADLAAVHFDNGLPWVEALSAADFDAYPAAVRGEWLGHLQRLPAGHKRLVSITPISISRDGLAPYLGDDGAQPLSALGEPWADADFASPEVLQAFLNHARVAIGVFDPDILVLGIEVNLLRKLAPQHWSAYVELQRQVYETLRSEYRGVTLMLSFTPTDMLEGWSETDVAAQRQALRDVAAYTEIFGISIYPYLTKYLTGPLPDDLFTDLARLSDKPYAITETGYFAGEQTFQLGPDLTVTLHGTPEKQRDWIARVLREADRRDYRFVINFVNRDYDALCEVAMCTDAQRVWQRTGFYDAGGDARSVLSIWEDYLARPLQR